jgi:hypothetical protein
VFIFKAQSTGWFGLNRTRHAFASFRASAARFQQAAVMPSMLSLVSTIVVGFLNQRIQVKAREMEGSQAGTCAKHNAIF